MERSHRVRYGLRFGLLLALAVGLAAWLAPPAAAAGAAVRLEPSAVNAAVEDGPIAVTVKVEGVDHNFADRGQRSEGLGVFQFSLHFDPDIVAITAMEPGPFLGSTGRGTSCFSQIRPDDESIFDFACISQEPPANGPQGSGALAQLTLIPLRAGRTELMLEGELGGPLGSTGDDIAIKVENSVLTVTGSGTPPTLPATPRPRPGGGSTTTTGPGDSSDVTGPAGDNVSNNGSTGTVKERGATGVPSAGGGWQTRQTTVWALAPAIVLAVVGAALILSTRLWTRGEPIVPAPGRWRSKER
jgi:hypothetical protein